MTDPNYSLRHSIHRYNALELFHLSLLGDEIANREGYGVDGIEATLFYVLEKYGLDPAATGKLRSSSLSLLLNKEMIEFKVPEQHSVFPAEDADPLDIISLRLKGMLAQADLDYFTELFGDHLSNNHNYRVDGREALELYLCRNLGYSPAEVCSWSYKTIRMLLSPEMTDWHPPLK